IASRNRHSHQQTLVPSTDETEPRDVGCQQTLGHRTDLERTCLVTRTVPPAFRASIFVSPANEHARTSTPALPTGDVPAGSCATRSWTDTAGHFPARSVGLQRSAANQSGWPPRSSKNDTGTKVK